jgi:hypothetical protein
MSHHHPVALALGPVLFAVLVAGCGARTIMTAHGVTVESNADGCIDIEVSSAALSCSTDQDCTLAVAGPGTLCPGASQGCGGFPTNSAAAKLINAEAEPLMTGLSLPCAYVPDLSVRCFRGQCTECVGNPGEPEACSVTTADGGTVSVDAGELDSGAGTSDGGDSDASVETSVTAAEAGPGCVDIDVSTYDISCTKSSDCILIHGGEVCDGDCACGASPVSASEQSRYGQAIAGVELAFCPCVDHVPPACVEGTCVNCDGFNPPAGCPGAG